MDDYTALSKKVDKLRNELNIADCIIIGAGTGLVLAEGIDYWGPRFEKYFWDFEEEYGFGDMFKGMFTMYNCPEESWAFWSRSAWLNQYAYYPLNVHKKLFTLIKDKDYFVLTTNIEHCFQRSGFDTNRLFFTQGEYGLWQCSEPCHSKTYDNYAQVRQMVLAQGFDIGKQNELIVPEEKEKISMAIPTELIPTCPKCGKSMNVNLRNDDTFVEDGNWKSMESRYNSYLETHRNKRTVFLEIGVGWNTPGIIKYPFQFMTQKWPNAIYVNINKGQADAFGEVADRSLCINADIETVLDMLIAQ